MSEQNIIVYINLIISASVLFFIIWDHFKDDRLLTKQVQEFYEDIEILIFTYIQIMYYKNIEKKEVEVPDQKALIKTRNRDVIQNSYIEKKIFQNFMNFSNYLGLTYNNEDKSYLNNTIYILTREGLLKKRDFENNTINEIIESYVDIKSTEISDILKFLNSLRFYWNRRFKKMFFRTELIQKVDFDSLLGSTVPLKKVRGKVKRYKFSLKRERKNNSYLY
ncbi:MAG: hypothetical protein ACFFKA_11835 [Candidatus Thorarchaeota archaeon]